MVLLGKDRMTAPLITTDQKSTASDVTQSNLQQGQQSNLPVFTQPQLNAQGQVGDLFNQIMTGNLQQFGPPQAAFDALAANHALSVAPQIAAVHGAGSPMISSSLANAQVQLAGQYGQQMIPNAVNAFNAAASWAFQPVGQNASTSNSNIGTRSDVTNANSQTTDLGGVLGLGLEQLASF